MEKNVQGTFKKLLCESKFEFKTVPCLLSTAHFSLEKRRNSAEHTQFRHVVCSREVCDQGEGMPLSPTTFRSTNSCFIARNTEASNERLLSIEEKTGRVTNFIVIMIFINCSWVVTRWQWLFYM